MKLIILLAAFIPAMALGKGFGIATVVKGKPMVITEKGEKPLAKGEKVFESDTIVTSSTSAVRLVMMDKNVIDVYPNSKLLIRAYVYNPKENNKNVDLEVSQGKIKSIVKQKYDNDQNKYNVKTPVIVAGVRGTIFSTEHELKTGKSEVRTLEGHVMVGRLEANQQVKEFFSVLANQKISVDIKTEKPQVMEVPKVEIEKQQKEDKDKGFTKVNRPEPEVAAANPKDAAAPKVEEAIAVRSGAPVKVEQGKEVKVVEENGEANKEIKVGRAEGRRPKFIRELDSTPPVGTIDRENVQIIDIRSGGGERLEIDSGGRLPASTQPLIDDIKKQPPVIYETPPSRIDDSQLTPALLPLGP